MVQNNFEKKELIINVIKEAKEKIQRNYFETFNLLTQRKIKTNNQEEIEKINNFQLKMDDAMNYTVAKLNYLLREENLSLILNKNLNKINDSKEFPYLKSNNNFDNFDNTNNLLNLSEKDINFLSSDELDLIDENLNRFLKDKDFFVKKEKENNFSIKNNKNIINDSKTLFFDDRLAEIHKKLEDKLIEFDEKEKFFDKAKDEIFLEISKQDDKFINFKNSLNNNEIFLNLNKCLNEILTKINLLNVKVKDLDQIEQLKPFFLNNFNDFNFKIDFFTKNFNEVIKDFKGYQSNNKNNQNYLIELIKNIFSIIQTSKKDFKNSLNVKNKFNEIENIFIDQLNDANAFNKEKDELIFLLEDKLNNFSNKKNHVSELDNQKNILNKIDVLVNNNIFKENLKSNNNNNMYIVDTTTDENEEKTNLIETQYDPLKNLDKNNLENSSDLNFNSKARNINEENNSLNDNMLKNDYLFKNENFNLLDKNNSSNLIDNHNKELNILNDNNFISTNEPSKKINDNFDKNIANDLAKNKWFVKAEDKIKNNMNDKKEDVKNNFLNINDMQNDEIKKNLKEYNPNNSLNSHEPLISSDFENDTNFSFIEEQLSVKIQKLKKIKTNLENIDQDLLN